MSTTENKTKLQQKSNLSKEKKNQKSLNEYLFVLGCLGKDEKLTFKPDGWSKRKITCPALDHPDINPSANYSSKSKKIY